MKQPKERESYAKFPGFVPQDIAYDGERGSYWAVASVSATNDFGGRVK